MRPRAPMAKETETQKTHTNRQVGWNNRGTGGGGGAVGGGGVVQKQNIELEASKNKAQGSEGVYWYWWGVEGQSPTAQQSMNFKVISRQQRE